MNNLNTMNPKVDEYLSKAQKWKKELIALRKIMLDCMLVEELKWGNPCYMYGKTNLILLGEFKESCVLSFIKGTLLSDAEAILSKPGENSQSARVIKFTNIKDIIKLEAVLKAYIFETIEIEKVGLKVDTSANKELVFPEELQNKFKKDKTFKKAFEALTPGRQRAYNMFFTEAKQSATRDARIEKYIPRILSGKGMNDCVCGLSKRMPNCDGSHKFMK
ncbi:MAG: YdeI/OmpD-associated family protein [Bacteroidetes bacterium]|nr:YdeI/OmpD-associated family protein [Bacteroidota bacterium]